MELVPVECPCGKARLNADRVAGDALVSVKDGFQVVRCVGCGIMRTSRRRSDYERLYTEGERYHREEMDRIGRQHYTDRFDHDYDLALTKRIPEILVELRSLDVGCANGAFVAAMKVLGFSAEGLELNPTMAEYARGETQCLIHESWATVQGWFDLITYHDVFEHIVDPRAELSRVRRHLRPEALLVLDCPDGDTVFGAEAPARHHEKPDQHLFYYTARTLSSLLASHQFVVERVERPIVGKIVVYARKLGE